MRRTRIPAPRLWFKQQLNISVLLAGNWNYFLIRVPSLEAERHKRKDLMMVLGMDVMTCTLRNTGEKARAIWRWLWKTHGHFARQSSVIM
jgi:hypothetical protein